MPGVSHLVNKDTFLSMSCDKFLLLGPLTLGLYLNSLLYGAVVLGLLGLFFITP